MPEPATHHLKNKELRLQLAAVLYFLSRATVAGFVFAVPAVYFIRGHVELPVVLGGAGLVTLLFLGYFLAASPLRCAACSNPVLMDNGTRKHPHALRLPVLSQRARVAWDILTQPHYHCMYCHTRCRCRKTGAAGAVAAPTGATAVAAAGAFPESVFSSVFGGVPVEPAAEERASAMFPGATEPDEASLFASQPGESFTCTPPASPEAPAERVVTPAFKSASVFPDTRTMPVTVEPPAPAPAPSAAAKDKTEAIPAAAEAKPEAPRRTPLPWEMPAPRRAEPAVPKVQTAPVPSAPASESNQEHKTMNHPTPAPASVPANPFLAAAAAQPPPPGPMLPPRRPAAEMAPAFPPAPSAPPSADGPAPWTLPSLPQRPAGPPPSVTGPVLPVIPDTAASLARRPQMNTAPVIPPAPMPAAFTAPAAERVPASLLQDMVSVLEEGQRSISRAFASIIEKLETRLTSAPAPAAEAAAPPPPAPQLPAAPAPVRPAAVIPAAAPAPMPAMEEDYYEPAPAPAAPAPAAEPESAPRRRFARPNGAAAQALGESLHGAFSPEPAPAPAAPQRSAAPAVESPFAFAPAANGHHPSRQPAYPVPGYQPQAAASPFAFADDTLTEAPGAGQQAAPFTFLTQNGEGHFSPKPAPVIPAAPPAISAYDALEDTPLPWMQPAGARR